MTESNRDRRGESRSGRGVVGVVNLSHIVSITPVLFWCFPFFVVAF